MGKHRHNYQVQQPHQDAPKNSEQAASLNTNVNSKAETEHATTQPKANELKKVGVSFRELLKRPSMTDWVIAVFTVVLAGASIYQFIILNGQLKTMRSDTQAWVSVEFRDTPGFVNGSVGGFLTVTMSMKNNGKTPATNVWIDDNLEIMPRGQDPEFEAPVVRHQGFTGALLAGEHRDIPVTRLRQKNDAPIGTGEREPLYQAEKDALEKGTAWMAVYGKITYEDVFRKKHYMRFCSWVNLRTTTQEWLPMYMTRACAEYNGFDRD